MTRTELSILAPRTHRYRVRINNMMDGYHVWGMHWGWWIFWVIFILIVVWLISGTRAKIAAPLKETPLEILKRRYAAGDISTEEYEERKARLEKE